MNTKINQLVNKVLGKNYGRPFPITNHKIVGKFGMNGWEGCSYSVEQWISDFITTLNLVGDWQSVFSVNIEITTEATTKHPDYHINEFLPGATNMRYSEIQLAFGHLIGDDSVEATTNKTEKETK